MFSCLAIGAGSALGRTGSSGTTTNGCVTCRPASRSRSYSVARWYGSTRETARCPPTLRPARLNSIPWTRCKDLTRRCRGSSDVSDDEQSGVFKLLCRSQEVGDLLFQMVSDGTYGMSHRPGVQQVQAAVHGAAQAVGARECAALTWA